MSEPFYEFVKGHGWIPQSTTVRMPMFGGLCVTLVLV